MKWLELEVSCTPEAVEAVSFHLSEIGCKGVAIDDPSFMPNKDETHWDYCDLPSREGEPVRVRGHVALVDAAASGAEVDLMALPVVADIRGRLAQVSAAMPEWGELSLALRTIEDEDWADAWKKHYHPVRLGRRLLIMPLWEEAPVQPGDAVIRLNPGMAFGTGTHPTTTLCLTLLEALMDKTPVRQVIDWGTGSGILAIAAAKLGARDIYAVDIDPVAVAAARDNADVNGVLAPAGAVRIELGTAVPAAGSAHNPTGADLVLANIMADIIIGGAADCAAGLKPGGHLIASGIIRSRRDDVVAALAAQGLKLVSDQAEGEWVALLARKDMQ